MAMSLGDRLLGPRYVRRKALVECTLMSSPAISQFRNYEIASNGELRARPKSTEINFCTMQTETDPFDHESEVRWKIDRMTRRSKDSV